MNHYRSLHLSDRRHGMQKYKHSGSIRGLCCFPSLIFDSESNLIPCQQCGCDSIVAVARIYPWPNAFSMSPRQLKSPWFAWVLKLLKMIFKWMSICSSPSPSLGCCLVSFQSPLNILGISHSINSSYHVWPSLLLPLIWQSPGMRSVLIHQLRISVYHSRSHLSGCQHVTLNIAPQSLQPFWYQT